MALNELLDVYDACGRPLGVAKPRWQAHRDGDWHKTFHCWIIYRDDAGQDRMLFQKRGSGVELWPNRLDITAAGHYRAGETIASGGVREIEEELGLTVSAQQLLPAGIHVNVDEFVPGRKNHEFHEVYFFVHRQELSAYRPDPQEVAGLVPLACLDVLRLFAGEIETVSASGRFLSQQHMAAEWRNADIAVSIADFVPSQDQYIQRVALCAQRILRGERYIWV